MNKKISNSSTIQSVVQSSVETNGRTTKKAGRKKKPVLTKARFNFYLDKDVYEVLVMEGVAIAVSAIIVYAYIMTVTGGDSFGAYYGEMRSALSIKLGIAHLVSFVFAVGRAYLRIRRSA